jgi:hypothetical protein
LSTAISAIEIENKAVSAEETKADRIIKKVMKIRIKLALKKEKTDRR